MSTLDLFSILSPDEQARADRFKFNIDRKRFIARRGLLRIILADYLDVEPAQIRFCYGLHGKPAIDMNWLGRRLQFNLSHSKDIALFAVGQDCQLGIDIEFVRPIPDAASLADVSSLPGSQLFYTHCQRKRERRHFYDFGPARKLI